MAAAWKLPIVYVCENNLFGISVDIRKVTGNPNLADRAVGYGIPGVAVDGNDIMEVYRVTQEAFARARKTEGPTLIECKTYRQKGHHIGDPGNAYRLKKELEDWKKRDPIKTFKARLIEEKFATEEELKNLEEEAKQLVKKAVQFAEDSPFPSPEEAFEDLFYEMEGVKTNG
ncbi:2-oxoisovalerate dehydrogenase subunit alpha [subsurface metagenome]